nr:phage major capsid protein [uncultured Lachnoclostridium sp.]
MNLDKITAMNKELSECIKNGDTETFVNKLNEKLEENVLYATQNEVNKLYEAYKDETDDRILASNGIRPLASEEKTFYDSLIQNTKNELTNFEVTLPKVTENKIFEDIERDHPLLSAIDFVNSKGLTEWILNKDLNYAYKWGDLNDTVTQEASAAFTKVEFSQFKLSCWIPVPKTMLDLGMIWLDQFVTRYLSEIIARALEHAIINGTGQKQPVGMIKTVDISNQTTPAVDKEATKITSLDTTTFGAIAAKLTDNGKRNVSSFAMIVNPLDYWELVYPALFYTNENGQVVKSNLPITIYQSLELARGKAIFGLPERYFATAGFGATSGKIEYSDHYKFLEDVRTFKARCVAWGTPKDNTSFYVYDITELEPAAITVKTSAKTAVASQKAVK